MHVTLVFIFHQALPADLTKADVVVSTVENAMGLEFDTVTVIGTLHDEGLTTCKWNSKILLDKN